MSISEQEIIDARERLFKKVVDYFRSRKGVKAIFVGGSVAEGTTDAYSDIDFRIVVDPEYHKKFVSDRLSMPKNWGEWLFNEWIEDAIHCVSHFKPFNKVDVFYFTPEHLKPSPWYSLPVRIVYDPEGLVARLVETSRGLTFSHDIAEIDRSISRVISCAQEVYRRVRREELFFAHAELTNVRYFMAHLDDYFRNNPPRAVALSHYENRGSDYIVKAIMDSDAPLQPDAILKSCNILLTAFLKQMDLLYQKFRFERIKESDEFALKMVMELSKEYLSQLSFRNEAGS